MSLPVIPHFIAGRPVPPTPGGPVSDVHNPATGAVTAHVVSGSPEDVDAAVAAAKAAFPAWSQASLGKRTAVLFAFRELLHRHAKELGALIVAEHGKVLSDAIGEVGRGLDVVEYACGVPELLKGEYSDQASTGLDVFSFREPLGVVAGITPFNFPVMVPMWMAPMAIATGNTFVLMPSKQDPSPALFLADLWQKAGLPDGVFNVVQGGRHVVTQILAHPDIEAVSFVGSTPVAEKIHDGGTKTGKRVQALGGAKNHGVVLADADLDHAADSMVAAAFGAAGERCMAIATAVVVEDIADAFIPMVVERARKVRVRDGMDADADMGAIISAQARDRIEETVASAEEEGAAILLDGRGFRPAGLEAGFFTGPTIIDHVTTSMRAYREEIFGPVLTIVRVPDLDAAIELINANPFGNGTAIFTSSGEAARRFQRGVQVGMIGVNVPIPVPVAYHSFGGWKDSLIGQSHIYGPEGIAFYTRGKVVTQRWPRGKSDGGATFHFAGASSAES
jgi:malonate-semialdehyde dehydrogenase (acetylating)/methylmalonate-semialdehyde dehydrogenase